MRLAHFVSALLLLALLSPGRAAVTDDFLALDASQARLLGISDGQATAAAEIVLEHLPGSLEPALEHSAVVTAPYAGTVTRVLVLEGSDVEAGAVLAIIQSRDWLDAQGEAVRSASQARLAGAQAQRDAALLAEGIIPAARAEASRALQAQADASAAQARRALALAPAASPDGYELRAPLAGRVMARSIAPGQAVAALAAAFTIADPELLDVSIKLPAHALPGLAPGLPVRIEGSAASGEVRVIASAIDAASQSLAVRARFSNDGSLVPGQLVAVDLQLPAPPDSLALPRGALVRHEDSTLVFVSEAGGYRAQAVELLGESAREVIVRGAIVPGTAVAITGTSALKALFTQAD